MRNVHAIRKYGVGLPVFFFGYTSTSTSEQCEFHASFFCILQKHWINMRKIKLYIATSIDGYIARSDGDLDWLTGFPNPEKTDYGYQTLFESIDIVIMGGRTYRDILSMDVVWPYQAKNTYVITHHSLSEEKNIQFITHDIVETITQIRNENGQDIWLVGGGEIASMLLNHELIDEMIITTVPIILGNGIPLFSKITKESQWEISIYHKYKNGVTQSHYKIKR